MTEETLWVDFKKKSLDKNTSIWYESLVFDISRMLKYYTENEIYAHLERLEVAPDTLHYAIREAKEEYNNGTKN